MPSFRNPKLDVHLFLKTVVSKKDLVELLVEMDVDELADVIVSSFPLQCTKKAVNQSLLG